MRRDKRVQRYLAIVVGVMMVLTAVPFVSAFEASAVNVTSYIKLPIVSGKTFTPAPVCPGGPAELCNDTEYVNAIAGYDPGTAFVGGAPDVVYTFQKACWLVSLNVSNATSNDMTQVVLLDRFSAELNAQSLTDLPIEVYRVKTTKGKAQKNTDVSATTIRWWVDYLESVDSQVPTDYDGDGDPAFLINHEIEDNDGNFRTPAPGSTVFATGEQATAEMLVCTKLNPAGKQEYTSGGCYNFNSGIVIKWLFKNDPEGDQYYQSSFEGNKLWVAAQDGSLSQPFIDSCVLPNP